MTQSADELAEHRQAKTDPCETIGRFIASAPALRNDLDNAYRLIATLNAEVDRLTRRVAHRDRQFATRQARWYRAAKDALVATDWRALRLMIAEHETPPVVAVLSDAEAL